MLLLNVILYLTLTLQTTVCANIFPVQSYNSSIQALSELIQHSRTPKTVQDVQLEREFITTSEKVWQKYKNKEYALLTLSRILTQKHLLMLQEMDTYIDSSDTTPDTSTAVEPGFNLTRHLVCINSGLRLALEKTPLSYYGDTLKFLRKTPRTVIVRMYKEITAIAEREAATEHYVSYSENKHGESSERLTTRNVNANNNTGNPKPGLAKQQDNKVQSHATTKRFLGGLATSLILMATLMDTCGNSPVIVCQILLVLVVMGLLFWAAELTYVILDTHVDVEFDVLKFLIEIAKG